MLEGRMTSLKMVYKSVRNEDLKLSRWLREVYFCIGYSVFISMIGYSTNLKQTQNHKQNKPPECYCKLSF